MAEEGGKRLDETEQYKVKYRETHKYKNRQTIKPAEISIYHDKATTWLKMHAALDNVFFCQRTLKSCTWALGRQKAVQMLSQCNNMCHVSRSLLATPPIHDLCTTCIICKGSSNQRSEGT